MRTVPAVGKTLADKVHDGKVLVAIYNGHTTNWQNTIGKTLAGKILRGQNTGRQSTILCTWNRTLPAVALPMKYFAHRVLPPSTLPMSILPIVFCQYVLRIPVFCPLQARYILVKYWLAKNHMQSTNVQSTTGNLPVGKRHYGQRTSWQRPIGLNTTGKWMLGKMLRGQYDWQANYDRPHLRS